VELAIIFATSFVVGLSGALMPGPLMTVTIDYSARRGFRTGMLPLIGHAAAETAVVVALVLGLSQLIQGSLVKGTVGLVGGAVLAWMGYGMGKEAWLGKISLALAGGGPAAGPTPIATGVLVSISNPYWLLWWATVGANYVAWSLQWGTAGLATFLGAHLLSDLAWLAFIAAVIVTGRKVLNDTIYRGLILVCGLFLVGLGLYFAVSGFTFLRG
jgi:threonine/homoserine/homoserine lactone efflux protein